MEFGSVFAAPVKETIAGADVVFPVLTCADLATLVTDIRDARVSAAERAASARKFSDVQTYNAIAMADRAEVSINDILDRISSLQGSETVIRASLVKAGHPTAYVDRVLSLMSLVQQGNVAMSVTRVKAPMPLRVETQAEKDINRPLVDGATGGAPSVIGSPRTPTSDTPTESTPAR